MKDRSVVLDHAGPRHEDCAWTAHNNDRIRVDCSDAAHEFVLSIAQREVVSVISGRGSVEGLVDM